MADYRRLGRCWVFEELARGGTASVHFGRLTGERGFSRLVAVKMLRADRASQYYVKALEAEARVGARIQHPNVVPIFDLVSEGDEMGLVMEYVQGCSVDHLLDAAREGGVEVPPAFWIAIVHDALLGLHAAHEATDGKGAPLGLVHRDVSPQNVLAGADGIARLMDFGIARSARSGGEQATLTGAVKGKAWYMSPEQRRGLPLTRQADVYSAGVMLAEALSGIARDGECEAWQARVIEAADSEVVRVATDAQAKRRYATAAEMAEALDAAMSRADIARMVSRLAGDFLDVRAERARAVEATVLEALSPETAPLPRSRATRVALGSAVLLASAAAVVFAFGRRPPPPPLPDLQEPAATTTIAEIAPASAASTMPPASPDAVTIASARKGPRHPVPKTATADCNPPFHVDAAGKRHYIPACLEHAEPP